MRRVETKKDLRRFIDFPYKLHRRDPLWVPQLRMDVRKLLDKKKHPYFEHGEADFFLAERDGKVVGRIMATENRAHNEFHEDRVGFFGFFETIDDQEVASELLDTAAAWLRARDLDTIRGPASYSSNEECGMLVEGIDTPPTILNPHNPPYYPVLVEGAGFAKAKDLIQFQSTSTEMPERLVRAAELIARRKGITLRSINMKRYREEIETVKKIYNEAWEKNWGFVPMTDAEVDRLADDLKPVLIPDFVVFAEMKGKVIGFAAALPDMNVALKKNPSGRIFPGIIKILLAARKIKRLRILMLGLLPEYRKTGADALMYHRIWAVGQERGFNWGEGGWILEDNTAMKNALERIGFEPYKTLRLYDRAL